MRGFLRLSFWTIVAAAWLALALHAVVARDVAGAWFDDGLYNVLLVASFAICLARALFRREERGVWLAFAAALGSWTAGDLYYTSAFGDGAKVPFPSWSDAGYLGFYPFAYVGLILLVRSRVTRLTPSVWLDGVAAALATAAVGASVVLGPVLRATSGSTALVATNLTYPIGDTLLLAIVAGVFAVTGWRPGGVWTLLGGSLVVSAAADTLYLADVASGGYVEGTLVDALFAASAVFVAAAAWAPRRARSRGVETQALAAPVAIGALAVALVLYDHFVGENAFATIATAGTLVCLMSRAVLVVVENRRLLARSRHEAVTDTLTGLGNRRKLAQDAERALAADGPFVLALFDLNGFKGYNDRFGHPAGDAMLARLGARLDALTRHVGGHAYRMGGDEFCALLTAAPDARTMIEQCRAALSDAGDGFSVSAACGWATPAEVTTLDETLRLVDQRLYADKNSTNASPLSQTRDVLRRVLEERLATPVDRFADVVELAGRTASELGLADGDIELARLTAELHDIGKTAIPDAILEKPGPLDAHEWEYVRGHATIGERIVGSAPALERIARLVRSTHERVDGMGYPDGLVSDEIPLPARIVAVVDAFDAMTRERPHAAARPVDAAIAELDRCSGTQFDPDVVSAFTTVIVRTLLERSAAAAAAAGAAADAAAG